MNRNLYIAEILLFANGVIASWDSESKRPRRQGSAALAGIDIASRDLDFFDVIPSDFRRSVRVGSGKYMDRRFPK
jgi:hypothetical protein